MVNDDDKLSHWCGVVNSHAGHLCFTIAAVQRCTRRMIIHHNKRVSTDQFRRCKY